MSRSQQPDGADPLTAHDQQVLDFEAVREDGSTSWERADPRAALLERWGRYGFLVMLPDGDPHFCALGTLPDGRYTGWCKCKGFRYHESPCAHLCAVRKAEFGDLTDDRLQDVVTIYRVAEVDDMVTAEQTAAQRTGEVFEGADADQAASDDDHGRLDDLSPRQREVFLAVHERDLAPTEAADELGIDGSTARTHLSRARDKLGIEV